MSITTKSTSLSLAIATAAGLFTAPPAFAQDASLEEIVVTARKREERMQDVAIPVSALSKTEIERAFARDISDLASVSPNLIIDDTAQGPGGVAAIFIRGIGVADVEKNFDPAVGVVLDGIFLGSNAGSILRSIDLASVEVLRGPQGTLFGRNTIGGLINITTTQPTGELGAKVRVGVEDYNTWYADGIFNFGLGESLAAKISLAKRDQREGYYDNVTLDEDAGKNDYESYGINLLWEPTDDLAFEYTYKKEETDQDTPPLLNTGQPRHLFCFGYGYCSPSLDKPITGDRRKIAQVGYRPIGPIADRNNPFRSLNPDQVVQVPMDATFDTDLHSFEVRWDLNANYRVDYLFGHWESDETILSNWDGTPELLYGTDRPADYEQDSHELRLTYDARNRLSFVLGGYLWNSKYSIDLNSYIGFNPPGQILDIYQGASQETDSWAVFFEGDYKLTDALTLTLGGRYTEDEKENKQYGLINTITPPYTDHPDEKWDEFTPRVGLSYNMTDDVMLYATYSRGYRSGGFNGRVSSSLAEAIEPYDPETVDNYEVGIKSEWLDNRLRVNANVFYMEYDDKQEELQLADPNPTGQKTVVSNAASATVQGVEFDVQAFLGDGLTLRGNLGWLDTEYDDFQYVDQGELFDLSDREFRRAPDWTGSLDATYEFDLGSGHMWLRGAYHYIGDHFVNVSNVPELENDEQQIVDASVNYSISGFTFSLFGRNLTDEDGYIHGYDVAGVWSYAATRPPRTYGFEMVYNFGE